MCDDLQRARDAMINHLHGLADEQDEQARRAAQQGDAWSETAHRGAAVGLRMAAAAVSERLVGEPAGDAGVSLWMGPAVSALAAMPARASR